MDSSAYARPRRHLLRISLCSSLHAASGCTASVAEQPGCAQVEDPTKYGVVVTKEDGRVERFVEKPKVGLASGCGLE